MSPHSPALHLWWLLPLISAFIGAGVFVIIYNGLVRLTNRCDQAWSNIDVLLKQRYDEIPNLVKVCDAYLRHERETLMRLMEARRLGLAAPDPPAADRAAGETAAAMAGLFAVAERYPELKANEQFLRLQKRITGIENEIADRREYFNSCVTNYNIRVEQVPDVIVARMLGYRPRRLLRLALGG